MTTHSRRWSRNPETRAMIEHALKRGWTVEVAGGGHLKMRSPSGELIVSSASGSDRRAHLNLRALLRQKGLDV